MIIDTHCHIYKSEMENAEGIIKEAAKRDIHMIVNGTDPQSNLEVLEMTEKYGNVHAALGYLYSFADKLTDDDVSEIMHLESYLDKIPDYLALDIMADYQKIKLELLDRVE